jgi:hypothetical protein
MADAVAIRLSSYAMVSARIENKKAECNEKGAD